MVKRKQRIGNGDSQGLQSQSRITFLGLTFAKELLFGLTFAYLPLKVNCASHCLE